MTKLNQILAIEKGAKNGGNAALTGAYHLLQKTALLTGLSRTYQARDDEGERLPGENTIVQVSADAVIRATAKALTRMWDVAATKDWTNTRAKADVIVDGSVLLSEVPVTYLLYLEKQLTDYITFLRKMPILDPSEIWTFDEATGNYRTAGTETTRTKKVPRNHIKAEATDRHPAQVEMYSEDVLVGYWNTVRFSGALPAARVNDMVDRATQLRDAVKMAREHANTIDVVDQHVAEKVLGFILQ